MVPFVPSMVPKGSESLRARERRGGLVHKIRKSEIKILVLIGLSRASKIGAQEEP